MKNHIKKLIFIIICLLFFSNPSLFAQRIPVILVMHKKTEKYIPLKIHELKINVKVVGNLAITTMEMTFYNGMNRRLEGRFYFPLGEGQTVSRFAMNVGGKMREGVVVEKQRGRVAYESTVRRMIDPGLLEWTKGNNFKARIYPIPARGYKKLLVAYEQEIKDKGNGFLYILPLAFKKKVDIFSLKVEVLKQKIKPIPDSKNELVNFKFQKWNESYIAQTAKRNYRPNKQLAFLLPETPAYKKIIIEKNYKTGKNHFYLHLKPEILHAAKILPRRIGLIWDASGSTRKRNIKKELRILDAYFKKISNLEIQFIVFRNEIEQAENFSISNGNWNDLRSRLENIKYDGGTQLGSIDLTRYKCDEFILSTDGISNFGSDEIVLPKVSVAILNSSLTAQHSYLNYIAQKTGGVYINLTKLSTREAIASLLGQTYSFLRAEYSEDKIEEIYPSIPTAVDSDFSLSGILKQPDAEITLHFGFGNTTKYSKTITLDRSKHTGKTGLITRIWAQKKITELDMRYKKNENELIELGKTYSIVTRNTSLIVLDRLQDYIKHRIVPPEEEMRKSYYTWIQREDKLKNKKKINHLERVVMKFNILKKWWNTKFSMGKPLFIKKADKSESRRGRNGGSDNGGRDRDVEPAIPGASGASDSSSTRRRPPVTEKKKEKNGRKVSFITLKKWDPKTPYLKRLKKTRDTALYDEYLRIKDKYSGSSAFYLDVADFFASKKKKKLALRILSNIAEMELQNHQLLRILAHRLSQLGYYKLSAMIFKEVLKMRQEEPQSYRDLALVYATYGKSQKAIDLLYKVVKKKWNRRFPDIEMIALVEMNSIISRNSKLNTSHIDRQLIYSLPVDVRVVLNWDADNTDMDLWVIDPNGEKCFYSHARTYIGGRMSKDFTGGYGPEEYMIKRAKPGIYQIKVNYYGNRQQVLAGATTIQLQLFLNYGKKNQTKKEITLRLKNRKEVVNVGQFIIKADARWYDKIKRYILD